MNKLITKIAEHCKWEVNMADLEGHDTEEAKWRSYIARQILSMITLDEAVNPYYAIKYYFKDDPESIGVATVCVDGDEDHQDDDNIFFYFDHINTLHQHYEAGEKTLEEFVIVNYWSVDEEDFDRDIKDEWVTVLNRDVVDETAQSKHALGRKITDAEWRSISNKVHHEGAGFEMAWAIAIEFIKQITDK